METVLIHLGSRPPGYLRVCARQVRAVTGRDPIYVGARRGAAYGGPKLTAFRATERLSQFGFAGFWRYTAERFFVLEEHMRATGMQQCVHIESDNLLYASPSAIEGWLRATYGDGIAICPMTATEDTAAVMYVGSLGALERFNEALLSLVKMQPDDLLKTYGGEMANEMRMLRLVRTEEGLAAALPITVEEAAAAGADHVFDPGSYGQYVDGGYWQPGISATSDSHLVGSALAEGRYRILWDATRSTPLAAVAGGGEPQPLANLHVHSKRLGLWTSPQIAPAARPAGFPSEATLKARTRAAVDLALGTASKIRRHNWRGSA